MLLLKLNPLAIIASLLVFLALVGLSTSLPTERNDAPMTKHAENALHSVGEGGQAAVNGAARATNGVIGTVVR